MTERRDREFSEYVTARLGTLRRLAYLLCQDASRTDDIVQAAITRLYIHWGRASAVDNLDAYTRTIVIRAYLRESQSSWASRVVLPGEVPELTGTAVDRDAALDMRATLAMLPPRQRTTLVLRFYCDLTIDETARQMRCTPGTVKSQTAKALAALRGHLAPASVPHESRSLPRAAPGKVSDHG